MLYREVIQEAMNHFGEAMVMTGGYDEEIVDHYNEVEDEGPEVFLEKWCRTEGENWVLWPVIDEYVQTNCEPLAIIVSDETYSVLEAVRGEV